MGLHFLKYSVVLFFFSSGFSESFTKLKVGCTCVRYLHTVVSECRAGVIKLMRFFVLECKWDSHLAFAICALETPGVITALNYAQGQSAICIRGAFIWLMSGHSRHHPAWKRCARSSRWTAVGGDGSETRCLCGIFALLCYLPLVNDSQWTLWDPPAFLFWTRRANVLVGWWWRQTHWISINGGSFSYVVLCLLHVCGDLFCMWKTG